MKEICVKNKILRIFLQKTYQIEEFNLQFNQYLIPICFPFFLYSLSSLVSPPFYLSLTISRSVYVGGGLHHW